MLRVAAIVLAILTGCDYVAYDGQYTHGMLQVLVAIQHAFV